MLSDGASWRADDLGRHLEALRRTRPTCFLTGQRWGLGDDENRLSPRGAAAVLPRLPGWRLEAEGQSLRRRFELGSSAEAVGLLAAVQAFVGGDRWTPEWRCELGDRHLDLTVRAGGGRGLPAWLPFLARRLDRLQAAREGERVPPPSDREEPAPLDEEIQPPWRLSRDRTAILGRYAFPSPLQSMTFACLAGALAVLQSDVARVTAEIASDAVRLRLTDPAGGGVTPTVLLAGYDLSAQASACGATAPETQLPDRPHLQETAP